MSQDIEQLREQNKLRLIAGAVEHLHLEGIACAVIPLPGTERVIAIGTKPDVARLLDLAPAASLASQPQADPVAGDARECLLDVVSHHADFRQACENEREGLEDDGDREAASYWTHQIEVLDRMKEQAERAIAAPIGREAQAEWRLLTIIANAYQIAGAHDAPAHILGVLADPEAATDEQIEAMLPYVPATVAQGEQADEVRDAARYRALRDAKKLPGWVWEALEQGEGIDHAVDSLIALNVPMPFCDECKAGNYSKCLYAIPCTLPAGDTGAGAAGEKGEVA